MNRFMFYRVSNVGCYIFVTVRILLHGNVFQLSESRRHKGKSWRVGMSPLLIWCSQTTVNKEFVQLHRTMWCWMKNIVINWRACKYGLSVAEPFGVWWGPWGRQLLQFLFLCSNSPQVLSICDWVSIFVGFRLLPEVCSLSAVRCF